MYMYSCDGILFLLLLLCMYVCMCMYVCIVKVPKDVGTKPSVCYYYSLVVKHPVSGKPPIPVREYISCNQTVLVGSFFFTKF